jgi:hypothetical protein
MIYAPYLRNVDIGSPGEEAAGDHALPFVIEEGSPEAYIIVPMIPPPAEGTAESAGRRSAR